MSAGSGHGVSTPKSGLSSTIAAASPVSALVWDEATATYPARGAATMAIWRGPTNPATIDGSGFVPDVDLWAQNAMSATETTAPTVPTALIATATSTTTVALSWTASTDNVAVTGYEYRIDAGTPVDAGAGVTENIAGLAPDTLYSFEVRAYDAAGNYSAWSDEATATTTADVVAPTAGTLTDSLVTALSFRLTVTGAADETLLDASPYAFTIDDGASWSAYQAGAVYDAADLTAETAYTCAHRVRDAAGNVATGESIIVTTGAGGDVTPPTAGTLSALGVTDTSAILTVSGAADEAALHATPYRFSTDDGATYSAWQASASYPASGLTAETAYTCKHQVQDAAENVSTGTAVVVTTSVALPASPLWRIDASAITGLSDGDRIAQWDDLATGGNDLTMGTESIRPEYKVGVLNGLPVVRFDGTRWMSVAASTATFNTLHQAGATILIVGKAGSDAVPDPNAMLTFLGNNAASTSKPGFHVRYEDRAASSFNDTLVHQVTGAAAVVSNVAANGTYPANTYQLLAVTSDPTNATASQRSKMYVDDGSAIANNSLANATSGADADYNLHVGSANSTTNRLIGDIAEIVIYDSILSTGDLADATTHLMTKWGI